MNYLIFTGPTNVGKTTAVRRTTEELIRRDYIPIEHREYFNLRHNEVLCYGIPENPKHDFYLLLRKNGKIILCFTVLDVQKWVKALKRLLNQLKVIDIIPDLIIMTNRDPSETLHHNLKNELNISADQVTEVPLGRMIKRQSPVNDPVEWYNQSIQNLVNKMVLPSILRDI